VVKIWKKECTNGGAVADMFDDGFYWLVAELVDESAHVLD
jgi:hypothetical protein